MKLVKESLKDKVYNLIKERIFSREYKLGETLVIAHLSEELEVSNTPIREALSHLYSEGLLTQEGTSKYKVITLSEKKIIDLNQAILFLLRGSLRICLKENSIDNLVHMLEEAYNRHKYLYESNVKFDYKYIEISLNFDRKFVIASENTYLIDMFEYLFPQLVLASVYNNKNYKNIHMEEHHKLFESIKNSDITTTFDLLKLHFGKDFSSMEFDF